MLKSYFVKTPTLLQALLPAFTWRMPGNDRALYLSFDDGPIPEVTPWVLDTLNAYGARATFFCVGDNARKYPDVYRRLLAEGHAVGNHTFNHLNGWKTDDSIYFDNVRACSELVRSKLFRPPYGRLKRRQRQYLKKDFQLIMWDVLSGDFDQTITPEQCRDNVLRHAGPGSIVVLHDSLKAEQNLRFTLPAVLEHFTAKGYRFAALPA